MGTRSITRIYEIDGTQVAEIYRQYDGYFEGHGVELATIMEGMIVVNGISGKERGVVANGMGCLAAQVVAALKIDKASKGTNNPRAIWLRAASQDVEEYQYEIRLPEGETWDSLSERARRPIISGHGHGEQFQGTAAEWLARFTSEVRR